MNIRINRVSQLNSMDLDRVAQVWVGGEGGVCRGPVDFETLSRLRLITSCAQTERERCHATGVGAFTAFRYWNFDNSLHHPSPSPLSSPTADRGSSTVPYRGERQDRSGEASSRYCRCSQHGREDMGPRACLRCRADRLGRTDGNESGRRPGTAQSVR